LNFGVIWRSSWLINATLTLLFAFAFQQNFTPLQKLETTIYDASAIRSSYSSEPQIIILNIDTESRQQSRLTVQQAIAFSVKQLTNTHARLIGIDAKLHKPDSTTTDSTHTTPLIDAIRNSGNVFLPIYFNINNTNTPNNITISSYLKTNALQHVHPAYDYASPISASHVNSPYKSLALASAGLGHINSFKDNDGIVRSETLVIAYGNQFFPSLTLLLAAQALHVGLADIRIQAGKDIELGPLTIITDAHMRIYPVFSQRNKGVSFPTYTFDQLHTAIIPNNTFNNKIVLIGDAGNRPNNSFLTANGQSMTRIEFSAHTLQSILQNKTFQHPAWTQAIEMALLLIIGLYLVCILPRLTIRLSIAISSLIFITLISADWLLLTYYSLWLQTISAAILLLIGHMLMFVGKQPFSLSGRKKKTRNIHKTNKLLGISFQNQGMLDQAFEKFTACPVDKNMLTIFYKLAQAFERKRQFQQATAVYEHIASHDPDYQDIQTCILNAKSAEDAVNDEDSSTALSNLIVTNEVRPTLGRYELISELGKGAMGTVHLGKDPKINRKVAIKTMALSQEFAAEELEEVKAKFFHEAEIAGMLTHPNIVTIFDAGDEHDLAYIAMEFLDGVDLTPYTKKDRLLPFTTTLRIMSKVAEALQYAHDHGVIHRDIKPANIMILKNKTVKVTDFGIAHIIDCSKSKAGVVLGTPSYMSPEQLSGKTLDGRSDLFSLGVMLYELVSGTRPFRAESISKLMYKIAKQPHNDVREHNANVPDCIAKLIDELLTKKAEQRISTANEVLTKISQCLRDLKNNGGTQ